MTELGLEYLPYPSSVPHLPYPALIPTSCTHLPYSTTRPTHNTHLITPPLSHANKHSRCRSTWREVAGTVSTKFGVSMEIVMAIMIAVG